MKITRELLLSHKPSSCLERIDEFLNCFPGGIVTPEGVLKAKDYDLYWVAISLLPPDKLADFKAKTAPLQADFKAKTATLQEDYRAKVALLQVDYKAKVGLLFYEAFKE